MLLESCVTHPLQFVKNGVTILTHAARRDDLTMFEYLVERGADPIHEIQMERQGSEDQANITNGMIAVMLQRRQEWIDQAKSLAGRWHLPLIAVRTIHEFVVGFNWADVSQVFNSLTQTI